MEIKTPNTTIKCELEKGENSGGSISQITMPQRRHNLNWWLRVAVHSTFLIFGTVSAILLTRLYYEKGGKSQWVGTLVQIVGFPVLLPFYYFLAESKALPKPTSVDTTRPSIQMVVLVYMYFGILIAGSSYLYSFGFEYLPASTVSLISPSQLAFNALFSYFLNSQKFAPFILNSILLLGISSILLVANGNINDRPVGVSKQQYVTGFMCTIFGAATLGLSLASAQLAFRKVLKQSFKGVMDLMVYQSLLASILILIGFFASGDYKGLKTDMNDYQLGKVSYVMTVVWCAILYQIMTICSLALVAEVSALFSNVIGLVGLPMTPIVAVIIFHDNMDGVKGISMVLAIWGVISYIYQHYIDDRKLNAENNNANTPDCQA